MAGVELPTPRGFRGRFLTGFVERSAYSEGAGPYRILPTAVAIPTCIEDVGALVEHASRHATALIPRGAGSGMPGGNVGSGIVVDLTQFDRPVAVSSDGCAEVGAAVTWATLDRAASVRGYHLPPNPSSGPFCTLGGMVATNAAGPRSVAVGSVRDWVRGLEIVTADGSVTTLERNRTHSPSGQPEALARFEQSVRPPLLAARDELLRSFPSTRKNSAGYAVDAYLRSNDVIDLLVGSEGTLAIVTRVHLTLAPKPQAVAGLLLGVADLTSLGELVEFVRAFEPQAVELLDRSYLDMAAGDIELPRHDVHAVLLLDFERETGAAAAASVAATVDRVRASCAFVRPALSGDEHRRLWQIRHTASSALARLPETRRSLQIIEDGCVPVAALGDYIARVREEAREHGIEIVAFGHAGDGHLHVNALVDTSAPDLEVRLTALLDAVTAALRDLGGTPSGEHGDGRLRAPLLDRVFGSAATAWFRKIKQAFDPAGLLNPGVIVAEPGARSICNLKAGPNATPIPADVATRLRDIERAGDWARSPLGAPRG